MDWLELFSAALGGGAVVKLLEMVFGWKREDHLQKKETKRDAKLLVNKHLDPILKAGDDLVGKLRWLAQNDFKELEGVDYGQRPPELEVAAFLYLFAEFWARIQLLRREGIYVNLGVDDAGKKLLDFVRTLEERQTRLLERHAQRAIGDLMVVQNNPQPRVMSFHEFVTRLEADDATQNWFEPLIELMSRLRYKKVRQKLLVYGAVVHALLDTLDSEGLVAEQRPGWGNKLSSSSRQELEKRIFATYLGFVEGAEKYFSVGDVTKK